MTSNRRRIGQLYGSLGARMAVVLASRLRLPSDIVQDAVHDVFMTLLEDSRVASRVGKLTDDEGFRYLLKAAHRRAVQELQRRRLTQSVPAELLEMFLADEHGESERAAHELEEVIRLELIRLPQPYRRVLELLLVDRKSAKEIARQLGRPANTVYQQVHRGLNRLRKAVQQAWVR